MPQEIDDDLSMRRHTESATTIDRQQSRDATLSINKS